MLVVIDALQCSELTEHPAQTTAHDTAHELPADTAKAEPQEVAVGGHLGRPPSLRISVSISSSQLKDGIWPATHVKPSKLDRLKTNARNTIGRNL